MATQQQIELVVGKIDKVWGNPISRNDLFGNALKSINVQSVRGLSAAVEFSWPVTVVAGTNGSGKTTLLQLCSCAYLQVGGGGRNRKIGDWVRNALGAETPALGDDAFVGFTFWDDSSAVDIPYQRQRTRWGYPRRNNPGRSVRFVGIAEFPPRIERRDRLHVFRAQIGVLSSNEFAAETVHRISSVMGVAYDAGQMDVVGPEHGSWEDHVPKIKRGACTYGELHMGAGEQKVIRLVNLLEALPRKSLILLEEPEITLHPDAQRGLAWYLMDVAFRRGHQILVSTHSADLFETVPPQGRVLLVRSKVGVEVVARAPHITAARELARVFKANKDLILVEDKVGQDFLTEILRRYARVIYANCCIVPVGSTHDVRRMVEAFRSQQVRAIGVRDPDKPGDALVGLFALPGDKAPETLLLSEDNIANASQLIDGIAEAFERACVTGKGKQGSEWSKAVFSALASELELDRELLTDRLTAAWLGVHVDEAKTVAATICQALGQDQGKSPS